MCIAADKPNVGAGGPRDLAAPARLQLHVMDDGADRDGAQRHRVARLDVGALTGDDSVADRQALWRQDVALLAVLILDESDEGAAVRIVLQARNLGRHVELAALAVHHAVRSEEHTSELQSLMPISY